jgi:hypothetical protein
MTPEGLCHTSMTKKATAQKRALGVLILVVATTIHAISELTQTHWRSGFGALALVLGFILWLLMTKIPSECGVWKKDNRGYCRNPIDGLFFGCNKHTWLRPLGFMGLGRKPKPRVPAVVAAQSVPAAPSPAHEAISQEVQEGTKNRLLFYATMLATTAGVLSCATDVFGFFKDLS